MIFLFCFLSVFGVTTGWAANVDDTAVFREGSAAFQAKEYPKAFKSMSYLAKRGDMDAQALLGTMYFIGEGAPQDDQQALTWFRAAAKQGSPLAHYELAMSYLYGRGVPKDSSQIMSHLAAAAAGCHQDSARTLGLIYQNGKGVPKDNAEAYQWFSLAKACGSQKGVAMLADLKARMTEDDVAQAEKRIEDRADKGISQAQFLVCFREMSKPLASDETALKAEHYCTLAARQGHPVAQMMTAGMLLNTLGGRIKRDYGAAYGWAVKSAEQNVRMSQMYLATLYRDGTGVPKDYVQAVKWYLIAEARGSREAGVFAAKIKAMLSPEQVRDAKEQAARFRPKSRFDTTALSGI